MKEKIIQSLLERIQSTEKLDIKTYSDMFTDMEAFNLVLKCDEILDNNQTLDSTLIEKINETLNNKLSLSEESVIGLKSILNKQEYLKKHGKVDSNMSLLSYYVLNEGVS